MERRIVAILFQGCASGNGGWIPALEKGMALYIMVWAPMVQRWAGFEPMVDREGASLRHSGGPSASRWAANVARQHREGVRGILSTMIFSLSVVRPESLR